MIIFAVVLMKDLIVKNNELLEKRVTATYRASYLSWPFRNVRLGPHQGRIVSGKRMGAQMGKRPNRHMQKFQKSQQKSQSITGETLSSKQMKF